MSSALKGQTQNDIVIRVDNQLVITKVKTLYSIRRGDRSKHLRDHVWMTRLSLFTPKKLMLNYFSLQ